MMSRGNTASYPNPAFGYYRGTPYFAGEGAGTGGQVAGNGISAAGQGASPANNVAGWHPTILYLFGLLIAEFIMLGILSRFI